MTDDSQPDRPGPDFAQIPLQLMRRPDLSFGAKCLYARLKLYAGKNGICNPAQKTLATELGICDRRIRELLSELRRCSLLNWRRTQKASSFTVNPAEEFRSPDWKKDAGQSARKVPLSMEESVRSERTKPSDKKTFSKRGSGKDALSKDGEDYDYLPQDRKERDSAIGVWLARDYPNVRNLLREHLQETEPDQPSNQKVARIIQCTRHAMESEIREALNDFRQRGYGAYHIRTYRWFETALEDYFRQKRSREEAANPSGHLASAGGTTWRMKSEEIAWLGAAFDTTGEDSE